MYLVHPQVRRNKAPLLLLQSGYKHKAVDIFILHTWPWEGGGA